VNYISASTVARRLGLKTGTLAKWRRQGRGPAGAIHISATHVAYPEEEIERFLEERKRAFARPAQPRFSERPDGTASRE
jgi:transposase-like protein